MKNLTRLFSSITTGAALIGGMFIGLSPATAAVGDVVNPLPAKTYTYSSPMGARCVPTLGASTWHAGQDLAAADGTKISSIAQGTVYAARQPSGSTTAGTLTVKYVIDGKTYYVMYYHMWNPTKYVQVGQAVKKGQVIAEVGNSGPSTGAHLHLEIWADKPQGSGTNINPTTFMKSQGIDLQASAKTVKTYTTPTSCTYYATKAGALKSSPSSTSTTLTNVSQGDKMTSVPAQSTQSGSFLRVNVNGKTGWLARSIISPQYIAPAAKPAPAVKPATTAKPAPAAYIATSKTKTTTTKVNLRTTSSSTSKKLGTVSKGKKVTLTGKTTSSWTQITYNGKTGWVMTKYLK